MQNWRSPIPMKALAYLPKICARPCHGVGAMLLVCLFYTSKFSLFTSSGSGYHGNFLCNQRICIRTYPGSRYEVLRVAVFVGGEGKTEGDIQQQMQWQLVVVSLDLWRKVATTKEYTKISFIIVTFLTYMYKCVTLLRISNMTWRSNRQYWKWAHLKCEYLSESAHLLEPIFAPSWPSDLTKGGSQIIPED